MLYHNLEDFSHRLILGEHHFITSTSVFKRAMLTGYLSILILGICVFYIFFDLYFGILNALLYYATLINFVVIAFFLNRIGRYEFAKILLLVSTLLVIVLFSITEPINSGNYFNFFPLTIAAFALFDYNAIYKGIIFTVISIGLFFLTYYFEISIIPYRPTTEEAQATNFLMHYVISLIATVVIVDFLIRLSHNIESNLLHKDRNLIRATRKLKASQQRFELAISGSNAGIYDCQTQ